MRKVHLIYKISRIGILFDYFCFDYIGLQNREICEGSQKSKSFLFETAFIAGPFLHEINYDDVAKSKCTFEHDATALCSNVYNSFRSSSFSLY